MTEKKISEQMEIALAMFTGPITKYPAGKCGKVVTRKSRDVGNVVIGPESGGCRLAVKADRFPRRHRNDVVVAEKAKRRRLRIARAHRERIAKRNAAIRKRIGEVKR
jgi:hypothetical protein